VGYIQAVNLLHSMGKDAAVAVLGSYLPLPGQNDWRKQQGLDSVHLLLRLLFVPRDPNHPIPPLRKGMEAEIPEEFLRQHPGFPLVLVRGIPFFLGPPQGRFLVDVAAEDPRDHLQYCLEFADFRKEPLIPETDPVSAAEELVRLPIWSALRSLPHTEYLGNLTSVRYQVLSALGRVIPSTAAEWGDVAGVVPAGQDLDLAERFWKRRTGELRREEPRWDGKWMDFVAARYLQGK